MKSLAINGGPPVRTTPFPDWPQVDQTDEEAILQVLHGGKWGRYLGDRVETFEKEFAALVGAAHCVAMTNGTVSMETAVRALDIGAGDEIIVPAYTFFATVGAVLACGALPVMVDVDPDTFCIDPHAVAAAVTPNTRAVIPVHLAGGVSDMTRIGKIAAENNLRVIEDAAQSHLALWNESPSGTLGDYGSFSFQASKNLSAGEGGALVTNDERLFELAYSLHTCGREPGGLWYKHVRMGSNCRLTEFQGALLLSQMKKLKPQTERRVANAEYLSERLRSFEGISGPVAHPGVKRHVYHVYMMKFRAHAWDGLDRNRFVEALQAEGIPAATGYVPLHKEPFVDSVVQSRSFQRIYGRARLREWKEQHRCPVTERLCEEEMVWLPQNVLLGSREDIDEIVTAIEKIHTHRHSIVSNTRLPGDLK